MRKIITAVTLGLAVLGGATMAMGADEYPIKLDRPLHPGDSLNISSKVKMKAIQKIEIGGQSQDQKTEFKAELEGTETIDKVSDNGEPVKLTIKVTKCTKDGADLVAAGSTIVAENVEGKTQLKVNDADPADDAKSALSELVDTSKPDSPSEDQMAGTATPQKIGGTWPLNTDMLAKEISDGPIQLTGDQLKAESKLTDVSTVDGKPVETIKTTVTADVPAKDPNNGANVHDLKINVQVTEAMPVDDKSHESTMKVVRAISFKMDSPGPVITISIDSTKESKTTDVTK